MTIEESHDMLCLHNAVAEYIYFIIGLIQDSGPKNLKDIILYLKFFKEDVSDFIKIFEGKDDIQKTGLMLCTTSNAFILKDGILQLSRYFKNVKCSIYENILVTKTADLIFKGVGSIKDICNNLNLSNMTSIKEDFLLITLKKTPYFYVTEHSFVIIRQLHGLVGFDDYVYKTIIKYFLSLLQNVKSLSYNAIQIHSRCLALCGVQHDLVIFCALNICKFFDCRNGTVNLREEHETNKNKLLNLENCKRNLTLGSISVAELVFKTHGCILRGWKGKILDLKDSFGLIQCIVEITNDYQGVFKVYFNKKALRSLCDIQNLKDVLSISDEVEFDAEFCSKEKQGSFWKATLIIYKKHEVNVLNGSFQEMYLNYHNLSQVTKMCLVENCLRVYETLEKIQYSQPKLKHCSSENIRNFILDCIQWLKHLGNEQLETLLSYILKLNKADSEEKEICYETTNVSLESKVESRCENIIKRKITDESNKIKLLGATLPEKSTFEDKHFNNTLLSFNKAPYMNYKESSCQDNPYSLKLFLNSAFMFGEIVSTSENSGFAKSLHTNENHEIYFQNEVILFQTPSKKLCSKGYLGLFFIPFIDEVCVATLAYLLNEEEANAVICKSISMKNFISDCFAPKINVRTEHFLQCNMFNGLFINTRAVRKINEETILKFVRSLKDVYNISCRSFNNLIYLMKELHQQKKLDYNYFMYSISCKIFSAIQSHKKHAIIVSKSKKWQNKRKNAYRLFFLHETFNSTFYLKYNVSNFKNLLPVAVKSKRHKSRLLNKTKNQHILPTKQLDTLKNEFTVVRSTLSVSNDSHSCSSISSYTSCCSKCSSDDVFHSCESLALSTKVNSLESVFVPTTIKKLGKTKNCTFSKQNTEVFSNYLLKNRFSLLHVHLFKQINRRRKVILSSSNRCKNCNCLPQKALAKVSILTKSSLFLKVKNDQENITLCFPIELIPAEMRESIQLNTIVKATIIPHILMNLSYVLCLEPT